MYYYFDSLTNRAIPIFNFDIRLRDINEEKFNLFSEIILDSLISWIIESVFRSHNEILNFLYDYGYYYWDREKVKIDCKNESEMEMLMKQWASSSEGV